MTNATVEQVVTAVDGPTLTLKYKDGEKKTSVPANTPIVAYVPGDKSDIKLGAKVFIVAIKQPDGTLQGRAWRVGRRPNSCPSGRCERRRRARHSDSAANCAQRPASEIVIALRLVPAQPCQPLRARALQMPGAWIEIIEIHAGAWDVVAKATSLRSRGADTRERGWHVRFGSEADIKMTMVLVCCVPKQNDSPYARNQSCSVF